MQTPILAGTVTGICQRQQGNLNLAPYDIHIRFDNHQLDDGSVEVHVPPAVGTEIRIGQRVTLTFDGTG